MVVMYGFVGFSMLYGYGCLWNPLHVLACLFMNF